MSRKKPQSAMAALLDFTQNVTAENPAIEKELLQSVFIEERMNDVALNQLIMIDPTDCILWRFSDRPSDELGDIDALACSLKEHGQQEPILVRKNRQNTSHAYEIIFGNRRWRAAQLANIKLIAICKDVDDQQAALFQKEENENRKELSDYARAMSYRAQLDGGVFKNETELSRVLGISKQALNDLMAYLRVPEALREMIGNYKSLSKKMVTKLAALSKDRAMLDVLILLAPKISDQSITTTTLDKHIQSYLSPGVKKNLLLNKEYEKRNASGQWLYKTKLHNNGEVLLHIARNTIAAHQMEMLHSQFSHFLESFLIQGK
ncbi:MAG: hypothetical protein A3C44_04515 [Gammaproteobacteria bacterium RIFCSPHIGHO2_02_FULL_39_13]|nr:MAG: hypothetical protein A3C44_04515 [Gammaproteobacteria bacterium RIFCSPHIGHO2_02_FULL_39_13]